MEIFKVLVIAIIGAVSIQILKETNSPIATWLSISIGIIILVVAINLLEPVLYEINYIVDKTNIDQNMFAILLKIIGVGYLVEYVTSLCVDLNCKSIADKVSFAGKVIIFSMSLPVIKQVFNLILEIL